MQFIEKNAFNVRSAIYRLKKGDDEFEVVLFPMIHIGEKDYYREVKRRLAECDVIFVEGVMSKRVALLTRSYRVIEKIKRLGLVTQSALKLTEFGGKVVNADMSAHEFETGWSHLPLATKILLSLAMPFYVIYLYLFATRNLIAGHLALDDLPSRDEILQQGNEWEKVDDLIVDRRDRKLIRALEKFYAEGVGKKKLVGIVYGAMHMRAVSDFLLGKLGYSVVDAQWITVFNL